MGFIYKITNQVNGTMYIGKTEETIEERFKTHCREYKRVRSEKRPLYDAMKKYGIENFIVELIEETNNLEEREQYWIEYYDTYHNGYNATKGGDGKRLLDYDLIVKTYQELQNINKTAEQCHCDPKSVHKILKSFNISIKQAQEASRDATKVSVKQYTKQGEYVQTFESYHDAARAIRKNEQTSLSGIAGHISEVCRGKRKTAYGYVWKN